MDINTVLIIGLFLLGIFVAYFVGHKVGEFRKNRHWENELPNHRKDAVQKSRAVLSGQFSEQLAPYLPDFEFKPTECRFLGKPVDFIAFKGIDRKEIEEVVFVEVKSGGAKLSNVEKSLKKAIDNGRVRFEEYKVPDEVTKGDSNFEE